MLIKRQHVNIQYCNGYDHNKRKVYGMGKENSMQILIPLGARTRSQY